METEPPPASNQESTVEEPSPVPGELPRKVRRAKSSRSQHRRVRGTRSSHKRRQKLASLGDEEGPFSDRAVCTAFIRKLYIMCTLQLGFTVGIICTFIYWEYLKIWVRRRPWFCYTMLPGIVMLAITIACCDQARRRFPLDIIMLLIFTICEGMLLGSIAAFFDADGVLWSVAAVAFVTFGLSIFTLQKKWDLSITSGILLILLFVLIIYGCLCAILQSMWLRIIHAAVGTLIFSIYLLVDTQLMLVRKDHQEPLNPDEYIFAALNVYIDIFSFCIFLLQFVGWRK